MLKLDVEVPVSKLDFGRSRRFYQEYYRPKYEIALFGT